MWFKGSNRYFCKTKTIPDNEIYLDNFSSPNPNWLLRTYAITLVTGQHGQNIADDFFKCIILKATYILS